MCSAQAALEMGATVDGTLAAGDPRFDGAYIDYYAVRLSAAGQFTLRMTSAAVDPLILVFDDQGSVIAQAYNATAADPGSESAPMLTRVFDAGCTLVGASSFTADATGGYSLSLEVGP